MSADAASRPRILIVAGRDPSGAGIDADLHALADLEIEPVAVATADTDQDEHGVRAIGARPAEQWLAEALERARDGVAAAKLGLLPGAEHVRAAAELVRSLKRRSARLPVVVDPVIAASSGSRFLDDAAVDALRRELARERVILTPNLPEAAELAALPPERLVASIEARIAAAEALLRFGAAAVVLKGGHGDEDPAVDLVVEPGRPPVRLEHRRVQGGILRGTGCRFATRVAAGLALGLALDESAARAGRWVAAEVGRAARAGFSFPPP